MKLVAGSESVCEFVCVAPSYSVRCVCVCFWKIESEETEWRSNGVGSAALFHRAVCHSLEGMLGWITLLAATVTFQWGSTLSSPLSNPRWNDHLCKWKWGRKSNDLPVCYSRRDGHVVWEIKLHLVQKLSPCCKVWFTHPGRIYH